MKKLLCALLLVSYSAYAETYKLQSLHDDITTHDKITTHGAASAVNLSKYGLKGKQYLLSAAHLIKDSKKIEILKDDKRFLCSVVAVDNDFDICLLKCEEKLDTYELGDEVDVDVVVYHAPKGGRMLRSAGAFESIEGLYWQMRVKSFDEGSSGGGVVSQGKLCGVAIKMNKADFSEMLFLPYKRIHQFLLTDCAKK